MVSGFELPQEPSELSSDAALIQKLAGLLLENKIALSTAESCTGGGIGHWLTSQSGSSAWYLGGFITYSNAAKVRDLYVKPEDLENFGAVSEEIAGQMALGCANKANSELAIAVTGIAGPDGGTSDKPIGTVCFGWSLAGYLYSETLMFSGDRAEVRNQTIRHALTVAVKIMEDFSHQG
jgi:nicotinamide-nucleotide amidase